MTNAFGIDQSHYRFAEENGTEATSTLLGSEDTALTRNVATDSNIQLRILMNEVGGGSIAGATNATWQLQRKINAGAFANVTTTSTGVKVNTGSALTDGGTTTNRLTAIGTFNAGQQDDQNGAVTYTHAANVCTEHVFGLTLVSAELAEGDALTFQLLYQGAVITDPNTQGGSYNVTPTLNITKAVNFTANTTAGTASLAGLTPTVSSSSSLELTAGTNAVAGQAPTLAADANLATLLGTTTLAGLAPTVDVGGGGLTERLAPNAVLAGGSNLRDTLSNSPPTRLADIDEPTSGSPGPDAEWWTAVNPNNDIDIRVGFPTSSGTLTGTQTINVLIRGTILPSRTYRLDLYENGSPAPGSPTVYTTGPVNSTTGQVVTLTFQPTDITDQTGAGVELRIRAIAA